MAIKIPSYDTDKSQVEALAKQVKKLESERDNIIEIHQKESKKIDAFRKEAEATKHALIKMQNECDSRLDAADKAEKAATKAARSAKSEKDELIKESIEFRKLKSDAEQKIVASDRKIAELSVKESAVNAKLETWASIKAGIAGM